MAHTKLIFLDIDGTLTAPGGNAPWPSALTAIRAAQRNGHKVFLCTGRSFSMSAAIRAYGFDGAVMSAGGYVLYGGETVYDCPMPDADRDAILDAFRETRVFPILETKDAAYANREELADIAEAEGETVCASSELERWRVSLKEDFGVIPLSGYRGEPVYKITFMCLSERQLSRPRRRLEDRFEFCVQDFTRGMVLGELINRKFDKGRAILRMCAYLGVPVADTIGFGDSMNDRAMLETAGVSVCMGNGSPEMKKIADRVCPAVEEDGIARAFAELGLV